MKYRVFETEPEARAAQQDIYASFLRDRAALNDGQLDDWSNSPIAPVSVDGLPNPDLVGQRFPLYGQRASDMLFITEYGHTTAWAAPFQIPSGQWVFPSPDDQGVDSDPAWWPEITSG
jgi:hypothetical protein